VLAAAAGIAAGCATSSARATHPGLVWLTGGISPADRAPAEDIAKLWNGLYPRGPQVKVESSPQSASQQRQLLHLELNAGLANFDIFDLDQAYTAEFAKRGWLADLQDLRDDVAQISLLDAVRTAEWDDRLWAAPYVTDAGLLYYRSDLVEPPRTWDELRTTGRSIGKRHPDMAPYVADGAQYEGLVVQYLEYFWGSGGRIFGDDGRSVLFPLDVAEGAANFMREWFVQRDYAPGFETMNLEAARAVFQTGKAVFLRSWPYAYQLMNDRGKDPSTKVAGRVGVAPLPAFPQHGPVTTLGGHNLAVNAFSRDIPAATDFVRFVSTTGEVQRGLAQNHSLAPTMRKTYEELAGDPMVAMMGRVLPTARQRPATPEWATISAEFQQQIFAAYTGTRDTGVAVRAMRAFLEATAEGN
jgi:multiple sugar transport system substrate-binding protein